MREYTLLLIPDTEEGGFTVTVPALPGCVTQGDTFEEAIANAKEAIECWIADAQDRGEPVPEEEAHPYTVVVKVAA